MDTRCPFLLQRLAMTTGAFLFLSMLLACVAASVFSKCFPFRDCDEYADRGKCRQRCGCDWSDRDATCRTSSVTLDDGAASCVFLSASVGMFLLSACLLASVAGCFFAAMRIHAAERTSKTNAAVTAAAPPSLISDEDDRLLPGA
jgi:hypothetical protein